MLFRVLLREKRIIWKSFYIKKETVRGFRSTSGGSSYIGFLGLERILQDEQEVLY